MMSVIGTILSPIVWLMNMVLEFYVSIFSSVGVSILLLSFTFSILLLPLQKMGRRTEKRIGNKIKAVNTEEQALKGKLKGEELFLAKEIIYKKHGYHPIHSMAMGAGFIVMLPVLFSAILLFSGDGILIGQSFLSIDDLSKPDGLLGPVNLLPLLMFAITFVDAKLRFANDRSNQYRFLFISLVLLILVYGLPAGLVLYWTGSNIMSFIFARL